MRRVLSRCPPPLTSAPRLWLRPSSHSRTAPNTPSGYPSNSGGRSRPKPQGHSLKCIGSGVLRSSAGRCVTAARRSVGMQAYLPTPPPGMSTRLGLPKLVPEDHLPARAARSAPPGRSAWQRQWQLPSSLSTLRSTARFTRMATSSSVGFAASIGGLAGASLAAHRGGRAAAGAALVVAVGLGTSEAVARARWYWIRIRTTVWSAWLRCRSP